MQPEPFAAFHRALRFGPGHCPPDLFEGSVAAIVRGLKVHANNVAHARHVAIEETYPRLLGLMGVDAFHAVAERFFDQTHILGRSLDRLGEGFWQLLQHPAQRDLARAEWTWLEAFHAAEGETLTLNDLGSTTPGELAQARVILRPAVRAIELEEPDSLEWDGPISGDGNILLFARPDADVTLRRVAGAIPQFLMLLEGTPMVGDLPRSDLSYLVTLVEAGAISLEKQR